MSADGDGIKGLNPAIHGIPVLCIGKVAPKQCRIHMAVYLDLRVFCKHGIYRRLIINASLKGGSHGVDHQGRPVLDKHLLQFLWYHASMHIGGHQYDIQILQISQPHVGIMRRIRHVDHRLLLCFLFKIFRTEVYSVIVSVCPAEGDDTPELLRVKAVKRAEEFKHLPFKRQRIDMIMGRVIKRISHIIRHQRIKPAFRKPVIKSRQLHFLVYRIAQILILFLNKAGGKPVKLFSGRIRLFRRRYGYRVCNNIHIPHCTTLQDE